MAINGKRLNIRAVKGSFMSADRKRMLTEEEFNRQKANIEKLAEFRKSAERQAEKNQAIDSIRNRVDNERLSKLFTDTLASSHKDVSEQKKLGANREDLLVDDVLDEVLIEGRSKTQLSPKERKLKESIDQKRASFDTDVKKRDEKLFNERIKMIDRAKEERDTRVNALDDEAKLTEMKPEQYEKKLRELYSEFDQEIENIRDVTRSRAYKPAK